MACSCKGLGSRVWGLGFRSEVGWASIACPRPKNPDPRPDHSSHGRRGEQLLGGGQAGTDLVDAVVAEGGEAAGAGELADLLERGAAADGVEGLVIGDE